MTLGDLIGEFNSQADDAVDGTLWSTAEKTRFANEAERDAVERGFLIEDDGNGGAFAVTLTEGVVGVTAEVQTITVSATAGTFTVTYNGQTTASVAYNVSAALLQAALEALSNLVPGNVVVTLAAGVYTLTFAAALGDVPVVTVDDSLLTNPIVDIAIIAGKAVYTLDPRVLKIIGARLHGQSYMLAPGSRESLDRVVGAGWSRSIGTPDVYIDNRSNVRLVGIPSANDTLRLSVYRLPLVDMVEPYDTPEIHTSRHSELLDGMLARAYLKKDSKTYDPQQAMEHEARFTANFGAKVDANVRMKQRRARSHTTRINW